MIITELQHIRDKCYIGRIHSPGMTMVSWETTWDPDGKDGHRGARSRDVPSRQDGAISDGRTREM
ncbi:hypothetical protein BM1_04758 [Bipolaris maydis]|nr:hypothetical protein BM1_04758 [Bipolaris maydis]